MITLSLLHIFNNNQIFMCKAHTAITEVFPYMFVANTVIASAKSTCHAASPFMTSNVFVLISYASIGQGLTFLVVFLFFYFLKIFQFFKLTLQQDI